MPVQYCDIITRGAHIYIFLHGFRIDLKVSLGVCASGEFNLLWHFSCCRIIWCVCACPLSHSPLETFLKAKTHTQSLNMLKSQKRHIRHVSITFTSLHENTHTHTQPLPISTGTVYEEWCSWNHPSSSSLVEIIPTPSDCLRNSKERERRERGGGGSSSTSKMWLLLHTA